MYGHLSPDDFGRHIAKLWTGMNFTPGCDQDMWIQDSMAMGLKLHGIFEASGIPYIVTGGVASTVWGKPRLTQDIDLILSLNGDRELLGQILEESGFTVAGLHEGICQITDKQTIANADLHFIKGEAWELEQLQRRKLAQGLWIISPEDLILNKLAWGRGKSEKQTEDIRGILETSPCDLVYLKSRAERRKLSGYLAPFL